MVVPSAGSGLDELREQGLVTRPRRRIADLPPALAREESLTATLEPLRENERD